MTVAMNLAHNKINPPKLWYHYSRLRDNAGNTVAMYFAYNGLIPP